MANKQHKNLSDFVRARVNELGLSYREVADASGGLITHGTVGDVITDRVKNISSKTIRGLAKGLRVTEAEIMAYIQGKPLSEKDALKVMDYDGFDEDDLKDIRAYIEFKRTQKMRGARK